MTSDADSGEDKMTKGAKREGKTVYEIANFYTEAFFKDMENLNIRKPSIIEKASDHIDIYIKMIERLLKLDYAYISHGNVYFDISKVKMLHFEQFHLYDEEIYYPHHHNEYLNTLLTSHNIFQNIQ